MADFSDADFDVFNPEQMAAAVDNRFHQLQHQARQNAQIDQVISEFNELREQYSHLTDAQFSEKFKPVADRVLEESEKTKKIPSLKKHWKEEHPDKPQGKTLSNGKVESAGLGQHLKHLADRGNPKAKKMLGLK